MTNLLIAVCATALLAGCNALGGIQPDLVANVKSAGASCVKVESLIMGKAIITSANDTKGALGNGTVTINPDTCAITISNALGAPVPALTPGTTSTTTTIVTVPK